MKKLSGLSGKCGIYEIQPEDAKQLVEMPGAKNRPLKQVVVSKYARRMKSGIWSLSGEPIILNERGELLDGEHRLRACIEANKAFVTVVLWGEFRFASMGQGTVRGGGDAIALGVPESTNHIAMSAIATLCIKHERAVQREASIYTSAHNQNDNWTDIDNSERVAWIKKNPRAPELYSKALAAVGRTRSLLPISPATAAWLLAERASSAEEASEFFEGLLSGAGLTKEDVRLHLRQALSNRVQGGLSRPAGVEMLHWCAKAWSERKRRGRRVFGVRKNENFPFIR